MLVEYYFLKFLLVFSIYFVYTLYMKTLLALVFVFAFIARADTITYSASDSITALPSGPRHVDYSTAFTFPQFDPALGALNSISYSGYFYGWLSFETLSRTASDSFLDFQALTDVSLLGVTWKFNEQPNYGSGGAPCGLPSQHSCGITGTSLTDGDLETYGIIAAGAFSAYSNRTINIVGTPSVDLTQYIGTSPLVLPFSVSADASPTYSGHAVIGDLIGPQTLVYGLSWTYNYTPVPFVEAPAVAPEPHFAGLLIAVLFAGYAISKRRLRHV